ncbi:MAG: MBL fold metallo-hydrolase [Candidatus Eisenbacteria sp.]|nr:MBL fold metallo-hydrolase [Candidatus Eisenbacteria bacterium]
MCLYFKSLRSGSSGNCLMLWTDETRILIDCGIAAQRRTRDILEEHAGSPSEIDAVIVSHAHTDHIRYDTLRVFEDHGVPVYCHKDCLPQIFDKHSVEKCPDLRFRTFAERRFRVKDFVIEPVRVSHHPYFLTHGFVIHSKTDGRDRKIVVATDFNDYDGLVSHFADADFIFVEANYDPDLLRQNPNPNSDYHMENSGTGCLLSRALGKSRSLPVAVMLGHLSEERNSGPIALATIRRVLSRQNIPLDFPLYVAPRYEASPTISIA